MAEKIEICKLCQRRAAVSNVFFKYMPRSIEQEICTVCINRVLDLHRLEREWKEENINWYLRIPKLAYSVQNNEIKDCRQRNNWFDNKTNENASDDDSNSGNEIENKIMVPIEERFNLNFRLSTPKSQTNTKEMMTALRGVAVSGDNGDVEMNDVAQSTKLNLTLPENLNLNFGLTKAEPKIITEAMMVDAAIAVTAESSDHIEIDEYRPKKSDSASSEKCNIDCILEKTVP